MKKSFVFILLFFSSCAFAEEADPLESARHQNSGGRPPTLLVADVHRSLRDEVFVVETSDEDISESLNRVSGNIDLGFTSEDQTYRSEHHYKAGPFGQADAMDTPPTQ